MVYIPAIWIHPGRIVKHHETGERTVTTHYRCGTTRFNTLVFTCKADGHSEAAHWLDVFEEEYRKTGSFAGAARRPSPSGATGPRRPK